MHEHPDRSIAFDIDNQRIKRVVVEGETPEETAERIISAITGSTGAYR